MALAGAALAGCSSARGGGSSAQGSTAPGADVANHTVTIDTTGPRTGVLAAAYESTYGAIARLAASENTVNGWKIKHIQLDDQYGPARALANTQGLVQQDHVTVLLAEQNVGLAMEICGSGWRLDAGRIVSQLGQGSSQRAHMEQLRGARPKHGCGCARG
jgi:hypothetical protein